MVVAHCGPRGCGLSSNLSARISVLADLAVSEQLSRHRNGHRGITIWTSGGGKTMNCEPILDCVICVWGLCYSCDSWLVTPEVLFVSPCLTIKYLDIWVHISIFQHDLPLSNHTSLSARSKNTCFVSCCHCIFVVVLSPQSFVFGLSFFWLNFINLSCSSYEIYWLIFKGSLSSSFTYSNHFLIRYWGAYFLTYSLAYLPLKSYHFVIPPTFWILSFPSILIPSFL